MPPDFLTGPEAVASTNLNGFSAHVTWTTTTADGLSKNKSGDLLGRTGCCLSADAGHQRETGPDGGRPVFPFG